MTLQEAAFERARSSLERLGLPARLPALHAAGVGISRTVLGGSHSVAIYPPIDSLSPLDAAATLAGVDWGQQISLYVHIPFCETRCTFCHYTVDHVDVSAGGTTSGQDKVGRYLGALKLELAFWGSQLAATGTEVSSVYIGGGTPLILGEAALRDLMETLRLRFTIVPGAEICIEGSPLTITAPDGVAKLQLLKDLGITRLSFGIQSFDDTVLKYAARGYRRDVPIQACAIVSDIFENWNLDLIQGLYTGSPLETWDNLQQVIAIRPPHITWYHARFADRPQGHWYRMESRFAAFEDEQAILLGRMLIWQELAEAGYHQVDGNRFVSARPFIDPFKKIRTSMAKSLLGVGTASYSHAGSASPGGRARGFVLRNIADIRGYIDTVAAGGSPVATGIVMDPEEMLAASYATGLRNGRVENESLRRLRFECADLARQYDGLAVQLEGLGVLEAYSTDDGEAGLRLTDLGRLFEDETLSLFFSPAVKRKLGCPDSQERLTEPLGALGA